MAFSVSAGTGPEISYEAGGRAWARVPGFESVRMVAPRWGYVKCNTPPLSPPAPKLDICFMMVIVSKARISGEAWKESTKLVKQLETIQMPAVEIVLGCSNTTSNTAVPGKHYAQKLGVCLKRVETGGN